jgi:hypothetical protein
MRYRQIHLDFHTSEYIPGIGEKFDKKLFQQALMLGHVDSITLFSKCHHGMSYHPTNIGQMHPYLKFNLLEKQIEACKEINVKTPVYLSAGLDEFYLSRNSSHIVVPPVATEQYVGFKLLCFNTKYLDYLLRQIEETLQMFSCDGIFLDIVGIRPCVCVQCRKGMMDKGLEPTNIGHVNEFARQVQENYLAKCLNTIRAINPEIPIFQNGGHIQRGDKSFMKYVSHMEVESLPTGGWGYDHFPLSAKYCINLPYDVMGMTGKFHTTWGEFGGYKHPNALKYECSTMIAYGTRCSIGDQLHPSGAMDISTYKIIGQAYGYVEKCQPWCVGAKNVSDIALLSVQSVSIGDRFVGDDPDIGATRILLEGHFLFDVIDAEMNFNKYKLLILPDTIKIDQHLKEKISRYLENGGKLLLTAKSGLGESGNGFLFDIGANHKGISDFCPDYVLASDGIRPDFVDSPLVMYMRAEKIQVTDGISLGKIYEPYFNRNSEHFCGHQHAPCKAEASGYDCGVLKGNILYLSHPLFSLYRAMGTVAYKQMIINAIKLILGQVTIETNLPSTARVSLMQQAACGCYVLHLLYANTINRGGTVAVEGTVLGKSKNVEVVDDFVPLHDTKIKIFTKNDIQKVTLEPQGIDILFEQVGNSISFTVEKFVCHQMVVLTYSFS